MSRSTRWWLLAPVVVVVLAVAGLVWVMSALYPGVGLAGIPRDGYRQALEQAARARARVDGRTFVDLDSMTFRPADRGGEAFAWGTARCRASDGATIFYWVSLRWNPGRGQWLRHHVRELAPAGDEIYFGRAYPGQVLRARLALRRIFGGLWSELRVAAKASPTGADLPSSGL